jgi:hypothetical protein
MNLLVLMGLFLGAIKYPLAMQALYIESWPFTTLAMSSFEIIF